MNEIIDFLRELSQHNNREWFNTHKADYLSAKAKFEAIVGSLIPEVREFDPSIGPLTVADCTWRIYRDTRFSHDKRPYKTHMGAYFAPRGKKGPFSGYYFQVAVNDDDCEARGMIATGNYFTEPPVLKILREDIDIDEAKSFNDALAKAKGFKLDTELMLKRVPRGFDASKPYSEYFKYKNFCLIKTVGQEYLTSGNFSRQLIADFRATKPFLDLLNRAVAYVIENPR